MLGSSAPMVVAIRAAETASGGSTLLHAMTMLVELGAIAGLSSVMVVMMMAQPRIFYAMAKDGLLPPFAKKIHPKFRTPHITSIITGVIVALASGLTPIGILGSLVSIGTLLAFVIVSIGIIFLRYQRRARTAVQVPLVPFVPALAREPRADGRAAWSTWGRLIIWMVIGIVICFTYRPQRSPEARHVMHAAGSCDAAATISR
jgi:APA family basic amino acid/polyamine antiporter